MTRYIIRQLDIIFSMLGLLLGAPVLLVIYIVGLLDTGSPIFRQVRVGRNVGSKRCASA